MSESVALPDVAVPEVTLGDRMRMGLRKADMTVSGMAGYLGVGREAVGSWINDRHRPSPPTLMLWAQRTGVPFEWLATGECPRLDSNQRLTVYYSDSCSLQAYRDRIEAGRAARRSAAAGRSRARTWRTDDFLHAIDGDAA